MKWLLRPVFHEDGTITFSQWKLVDSKDTRVIAVHKTVQEFRDFWKGITDEQD